MKIFNSVLILSAIMLLTECGSKTTNNDSSSGNDTVSVNDTGYTGIKQFMSGTYRISEVNFKNGVREGLTKTYYKSGKLRGTFWYEKGIRQDSSCWFYEEGQLFRITPYNNDTIDGIQKQFYRTGELKAEMGYQKGLRTLYFKEFTRDGKLVKDYPQIVVKTEDKYATSGNVRVSLELSNKNVNVNWLRGEFTNGRYDTARLEKIRKNGNTGYLDLKKSASGGHSYVNIVAQILTNFGNWMFVEKKIDLPYNDLK